jgi:hypothetical protein
MKKYKVYKKYREDITLRISMKLIYLPPVGYVLEACEGSEFGVIQATNWSQLNANGEPWYFSDSIKLIK